MTPFTVSKPFTLGIEEELLLVDARTLELTPMAAQILERMARPASAADHEAYAAQIELRSAPSETTLEAVTALAELRSAAIGVGATLMGVGLHPAGRHGDTELVESDRYREVEDTLRGLIRRTPESALHIHVGMPGPDAAVSAHNGLRPYLPLIQALSANSPWWFGVDSGFASARYAMVRPYPGRGVPRALLDYDDWNRHAADVMSAGKLTDYTFLWSDIRLHPRLGTVEVREMDSQASLARTAALAAFIRALAREAADAPLQRHESSEAITWSTFRAARDGIDTTILWDGTHQPIEEIIRATLARIRPIAQDNGDSDAFWHLEAILDEGGGAARQRKAHADAGLRAMLESLVDDTHHTDLASDRQLEVGSVRPTGQDSEEAATRIARAWLDARSRCDLDEVAELTAENATWDSPVDGLQTGRHLVCEQIRAAFADTDAFSTQTISLEMRGAKGVAIVRNVGRRGDARLDSLQTLFLTLAGEKVASVRIAVDDPDSVEAFWSDGE